MHRYINVCRHFCDCIWSTRINSGPPSPQRICDNYLIMSGWEWLPHDERVFLMQALISTRALPVFLLMVEFLIIVAM